MPEFIGRPQIPNALANTLVQLAMQRTNPAASAIEALGQIAQVAGEAYGKRREAVRQKDEKAKEKAEAQRLKSQERVQDQQFKIEIESLKMLRDARKAGIDISPLAIPPAMRQPGPWSDQPVLGPAPGPWSSGLGAEPGKPMTLQDLANMAVSLGPIPKKQPAAPGKREMTPYQKASAEARTAETERKRLAAESKAKRELEKDKFRALELTITARNQAVKEMEKAIPGTMEHATLLERTRFLDSEIDKVGFSGFATELQREIMAARKAVSSGKFTKAQAQKMLSTKYPGLPDVFEQGRWEKVKAWFPGAGD